MSVPKAFKKKTQKKFKVKMQYTKIKKNLFIQVLKKV